VLEEHPVPAGPLAVRWLACHLGAVQAGAVTQAHVAVENAGSAAWRELNISYHWLDDRGNPIVWDGVRTPFLRPVAPGETLRRELAVRAPIPPGRYRLALDLVEEHRFWLAELGNERHEEDVDVAPRDATGARVWGAEPGDAWLDAARALHAEGYAAVGGAVEAKGMPPEYAPGGGRHPRFPHPLVCPSLLPPLEPNTEVNGLPAYRPDGDEPAMFDGRLVVRPSGCGVTPRSRSGRRRA